MSGADLPGLRRSWRHLDFFRFEVGQHWTADERTRLTRILTSMEARAFVERFDSASDGRSVMVRIAPNGTRLCRRAKAAVDTLTAKIVDMPLPTPLSEV